MPKSYAGVGDPDVDFYQMLHLERHSRLEQIEEALQAAQRWWNGQQANPKYRHQARDALARLREAREVLFDPIRRQSYDRQRQSTRQNWRKMRWLPVSELIDVLLKEQTCSHAQEELLVNFARRRNLTEEEIRILLNEEFLRRDIEREPEPEPRPTRSVWHIFGYRSVIAFLSIAFLGILVLALYGSASPAILLLVPMLNDIRLLVRGLYWQAIPEENQPSVNGWDWLVGIAVLGGASVTALVTMQNDPMLPLGIGVATLIWLSWLALVLLWQNPPPLKPSPNEHL